VMLKHIDNRTVVNSTLIAPAIVQSENAITALFTA
jgi:hypothetical protein